MLGHDDPTVIRMLQDITGVDPKTIPLDDKKTMAIFSGTESLGVRPEQIDSKVRNFWSSRVWNKICKRNVS